LRVRVCACARVCARVCACARVLDEKGRTCAARGPAMYGIEVPGVISRGVAPTQPNAACACALAWAGLEATAQGLLSAVNGGLGAGTGALVGGILFQRYGAGGLCVLCPVGLACWLLFAVADTDCCLLLLTLAAVCCCWWLLCVLGLLVPCLGRDSPWRVDVQVHPLWCGRVSCHGHRCGMRGAQA
jgi:hypothetical protein